MAIGEKYSALTKWLQECGRDSVRLSFDELNRIITIPQFAYRDRPAWANPTKPTSFCSAWLNAGYLVDSVSLQERWVVFKIGEAKARPQQNSDRNEHLDRKVVAEVLKYGYACYDGIGADPNHRYLSWEHCHDAFKQNRQAEDEATIDYLCLHLAWYLASWGMLRNSFLMQKDYKVHAPVVRLLYQPEWEELWDMGPDKMAQEWYASRVRKLYDAIAEAYVTSGAGKPTETLITKILLGTIGCTPAYDRYFKKGLSATDAAPQRCNTRSLMALGQLYIDNLEQFEALRKHCSERMEYPAAKILDMCFFEFGYEQEGRPETLD